MPQFTQTGRPIRVDTVLGEDELLLEGFHGTERVSAPFSFQLELLSEDDQIAPEDMLRSPAVVTVVQADGSERKIHGLVRSFGQLGQHEMLTSYRAEIVPWLWFLSLSSDCRIFQEMSVLEIVETVFKEQGYSDFDFRCFQSYPKREYCVQYRESHLAFVSRLLEEAGIFYFFEHEEDRHVLVLGDANSVAEPCPGPEEIPIRTVREPGEDHVTTLEREHAVHVGIVSVTDYDYLQEALSLDATVSGNGAEELFDYHPRRYTRQDQGERLARILLEEAEARRHLVFGRATCRQFRSGQTFELVEHYRADMNQEYLLLRVEHVARAGDFHSRGATDGDYNVSFVAIPSEIPFRPPRSTPRPVIQGAQTAEVVGRDGEEIWTDRHGRIKVQFHWDRRGEKDENSSCWVRVASGWAGKSWGEVHLPRIGQEVLVQFLEGDPDSPIVTGAVYNDNQPPPFDLPEHQTVSGMKSRSSKGGGGYNEISVDDRKGDEKVTIHAEKDMSTRVENDQQTSVGHDQSTSVGNDQSISVGNDRTITVGGTRSETVTGDTSLTVGEGDRSQVVQEGNSDEFVKGNRGVKVDGASAHVIKQDADIDVTDGALTLKTGQGSVLIDGKAGVDVTSPADVTVEGQNVKAKAIVEATIDGTKIALTGTAEITLKVGGNFVKIDPSGVTIFGTIVKIN